MTDQVEDVIPANVREVLQGIAESAAAAIVYEPDQGSPYQKIGYQEGTLHLVVDLIESVLTDPSAPRHDHMAAHWEAHDRRTAERKAALAVVLGGSS